MMGEDKAGVGVKKSTAPEDGGCVTASKLLAVYTYCTMW